MECPSPTHRLLDKIRPSSSLGKLQGRKTLGFGVGENAPRGNGVRINMWAGLDPVEKASNL